MCSGFVRGAGPRDLDFGGLQRDAARGEVYNRGSRELCA